MIECQECGKLYEPMTDAYKCPTCGAENYVVMLCGGTTTVRNANGKKVLTIDGPEAGEE